MGEISSLAEGRVIVKNSFDVESYESVNTAAWDDAYARYKRLKEMNR